MEITNDMLTDFQKELLELDAITLDEIRAELGGDIYGDRIQEMVIINAAKGYTKGRKDTVYIDSDFVVTPIEIKNNTKNKENNEEDIFSDLDLNI